MYIWPVLQWVQNSFWPGPKYFGLVEMLWDMMIAYDQLPELQLNKTRFEFHVWKLCNTYLFHYIEIIFTTTFVMKNANLYFWLMNCAFWPISEVFWSGSNIFGTIKGRDNVLYKKVSKRIKNMESVKELQRYYMSRK